MIPTPNIQQEIEPLRIELLNHKVYKSITTLDDLQKFLEYHVFAVWDFMSLLKALQIELTCVSLPWVPKGNPSTRKLINEIVLDEETDQDQDGNPASHYELYLEAMQECQSDTTRIEQFVELLHQGIGVESALNQIDIPESVKEFVLFTFSVIDTKEPHKIAAAFTFGREDLIPEMFTVLVKDLNDKLPDSLDKLVYYLNRHIELDADVHGPLAMRMIDELCGDDIDKWNDCVEISKKSLEKRIVLWDGILQSIKNAEVHMV
ncbi:DUF3050 domain-containing protein [Aquimarina sp. I32.4]|uniref:DUF3050 domain-containing protein n=1 Tax=Aquimarina sp. I32.4 TaxID=2053903 RepID=UPI000CDE7FEB|nr:DUF3050 domain-containing protein [Aquimarina sp. I32.4]